MGEVVKEEGTTILKENVDSVRNCEGLCDKTDGCESFKYCKNRPKNECYLKYKTLTGNEPTEFVENCASYYTAGKCNKTNLSLLCIGACIQDNLMCILYGQMWLNFFT